MGMPSRIAVASCDTSSGVKPSRAATCGSTCEVGCRAADGVVDSVFDVDHAGNLANGVADTRAKLRKQIRVVRENLDLDGLRRIRQVVDVVLQYLRQLDVEFWLRGLHFLAHVFHHLVHRSAAFCLQLHREVAGVGLGHRGQAHLQAGATGGGLHFRDGLQGFAPRVRARGWSR